MTILFFFLIFFIGLQAFFVAAEIAYISSSLIKLKHRISKGDKKARVAYVILSNPATFLTTALIGINLSVVISTSILTYILLRFGIDNSQLWVTFLFTPIIVIFAELIPKNVGRIYREDFSSLTAPIFVVIRNIFYPFIFIVDKGIRRFLRLLWKEDTERTYFIAREELKSLLREVEKYGEIERGEKEAIEDIFSFRFRKIKDVCIPLNRVVGLDVSDDYKKIIHIIGSKRYTRYPVFSNKEIIGYINIFDIFYHEGEHGLEWTNYIRPITKVNFTQRLYDVFKILRRNKRNIAVVMKGKKIFGIVTINDLIREIIVSISK